MRAHAALVADAQRLGAQALTDDRLDHALLLARTGVALDETPATLGSLLSVLQRSPAVLGEFRGEGWPAWAVSVSPDERRLALGDEDGNVTVYDLASRRRVGRYQQSNGGFVQGLRFSPDSRTLAVAGYKPGSEARPVVDLIDPASGRRRLRITPPSPPGLPDLVFLSLAFAPNGRDLLVLQYARLPSDPASILRRFDGRTGAQQRPPLRVGHHGAIALSPTGDRRFVFATSDGDGRSYEIDADRLRVTRQWPVGGFVGAVSADGRTYALGSARRGPSARSALRPGAYAAPEPSRGRASTRVHAGRRHARERRRLRRRDRLGRCSGPGARAVVRSHRLGDGDGGVGGRAHALHRVERRAGDRMGPRRRPPARPALRSRPAVRDR